MKLINRDISWLSFNGRVLEEAADPEVPLAERLKFLAIFSSNLDEFSRVRYPLVLALSGLKNKLRKKVETLPEKELAGQVQDIIHAQQVQFGKILEEQLLPALRQESIVLYYKQPILDAHRDEIKDIFFSQVLSFIQPVHIDGNTFDQLSPSNGRLYFVVSLSNGSELLHHYIINIPSDHLSRFFELSKVEEKEYIIFIDDIIRENIAHVFPGFTIKGVYSMKFNRDAELYLDEDFSGDVLAKIEKQLKKRDIGSPSRFLYEPGMPLALQLFLANVFDTDLEEMFEGGRYHNLKDLADLPIKKSSLSYPGFHAITKPLLKDSSNIFHVMEQQDVLLHFPYESYNPILSFFNQAAIDPSVTEIYIALYRVASQSHIVNALISAACNGKKVVVFVELKARFDEANNIRWSRKMEEAGIRLVYSFPLVKVHSKIALVVKKNRDSNMAYSLISTGNFNESTARFYTDHTLLTTDTTISNDLKELFTFLQKKEKLPEKLPLKPETLLVSGVNLVEQFEACIDREIKKAGKGKTARIRIKLNNLEEPGMIDKLYQASRAGVKVELIVRSICSLAPGIPELSENISVKRIVDRFLEHSRIFIFGEGEEAVLLIGSADWMTRNLYRRIEVCTPIQDVTIKNELIRYFDLQWNDNCKATMLEADGHYKRCNGVAGPKHIAQRMIVDYLKEKL